MTPRYALVIDTTGPRGNVFEVIGAARSFMRKLDLPKAEIEAFTRQAMATKKYEDAIAVVREYFEVRLDE